MSGIIANLYVLASAAGNRGNVPCVPESQHRKADRLDWKRR
jgi:hypothetical protein